MPWFSKKHQQSHRNGQKYFKITNLVTFEHQCLLNVIIEIKKTGHAPKLRALIIYFELSVIHVLEQHKILGKRTTMAKNL